MADEDYRRVIEAFYIGLTFGLAAFILPRREDKMATGMAQLSPGSHSRQSVLSVPQGRVELPTFRLGGE